MADSVKIIAQLAMDFFYQEFKPADGFLRKEHFIHLVVAADAKLKQKAYDDQVNLNLRKRQPNAPIRLSADNYVTVDVTIKDGKSKLPTPIMIFSGASPTLSVSMVKPEGNCGSSIMPLSQEERWQTKGIENVVFWTPVCDTIEFTHLEKNCNPTKAKITYIPQLSNTSRVQESRKMDILNMINIYVKSAKDGVIIDMSNDQNPNAATQTEINKYLLKALKNL